MRLLRRLLQMAGRGGRIQTGLGLFVPCGLRALCKLLSQLVIRILIKSKFSPYGRRSAVCAAAAALTLNSAKPNSSVLRTRASRALRSFAPFGLPTRGFSVLCSTAIRITLSVENGIRHSFYVHSRIRLHNLGKSLADLSG